MTAKSVGDAMRFRQLRWPEVTLLALTTVLRLGGVVLSTQHINPYALADATRFAAHARRVVVTTLAGHPQTGLLFQPQFDLLAGMVKIYNLWGLAIAPFYFLPGPSTVYARLALAGLGALAVWNIVILGRALHSRAVGLVAAFPVAVYPSFVLVQSTLLREATVLFLLTSVARLAIVSSWRSWTSRAVLCGLGLVGVTVLRWEMWPLSGLAIAIGVVAYLDMTTDGGVRDWFRAHRAMALVVIVPMLYGAWRVAGHAAYYLTSLHLRRAEGRTAYLDDLTFRQVPQMLAFTPVAACYFLFSPFPWMIGTPADAVVAVEALGNIGFAVTAVWGVRSVIGHMKSMSIRAQAGWVALCVWFLAGVVLFGLGTANVGTAVRHRQMFVWVFYLFGAVGFIEWLPKKIGEMYDGFLSPK